MTKEQNHKDRNSLEISDKVKAILKNVPAQPGVYKMLNADKEVIYVGKAKDLRKRLQSYFRPAAKLEIRKQQMVKKVCDIEYIIVNTELEALVLETNIIKELRPRYNVLMKDDKSYVYIRVTVNEDFPRINVVRKMQRDGARYFGPKTAGWQVKQTLKLLKKLFPYRHCGLDIDWNPEDSKTDAQKVLVSNKVIKYPCLDFHIKRCVGPCVGVVTPEEYRKLIDRVVSFLEGNYEDLKQELMQQMRDLAVEKKFEQAAALRDKLAMIDSVQEKQVISEAVHEDLDVVNFVEEQGNYFVNLFQVRDGKLLAQENFVLGADSLEEVSPAEVLQDFIVQFYQDAADVPAKILLPLAVPDVAMVEELVSGWVGHKIAFVIPQKGRKSSLLDLSLKNAKSYASQMRIKWLSDERRDPKEALIRVKDLLNLPRLPKRIECYDISHLSGSETVGSMVVFENGLGKNDHYRHFQIRNLPIVGENTKPDDFLSMEEVLTRRLKYLSGLPEGWRLRKLTKKQLEELDGMDIGSGDLVGLFKVGEKAVQAVVWVDVCADRIGEFRCKQIVDFLPGKLSLSHFFIPMINYVVDKFKFSKLYFAHDLELISPIPFIELGLTDDRTDDKRYILETYKFALKDPSLNKRPDLIIIDGGKGQLSSAGKAFKKLGITGISLVSLAKKREEVFRPAISESVVLQDNSAEKYLFQQIRDEAHRFAITFNRKKRQKRMTQSQLDSIPGVGEKMKMQLLKEFGSIEKIARAPEVELARVSNKKIAKLIKSSLASDT